MKFQLSILVFILLVPGNPSWVAAFNTNIGIITGYDDNVELTQEAVGSPFTQAFFTASSQSIYQEAFGESVLYFDASYKKFFRFDSTLDATAGCKYSFFPWDNRLMTLGFAEGGLFRDNDNPLDDFYQATAGLQLKYYYSGRLTFDVSQTFRTRTFLEPISFLTVTTPIGNGNTDPEEIIVTEDQDDLVITSDAGIQLHLYPWLRIDFSGLYSKLSSSIEEDDYNEQGGTVSVTVSPPGTWSFSVESSQSKKTYTHSDGRDDTFRSSGLIINKNAGDFEVFLSIDVMKNDSTFYEESYKQQVTQCGLSVFF